MALKSRKWFQGDVAEPVHFNGGGEKNSFLQFPPFSLLRTPRDQGLGDGKHSGDGLFKDHRRPRLQLVSQVSWLVSDGDSWRMGVASLQMGESTTIVGQDMMK